jgi:hypothetical protein
MSDQTQLTIDVAITTRTAMNTSTPRFGDWTYHHVLPVRLYFMTAWMMLHTCKHRYAWQSTRVAGRNALVSMCQNTANKNTIKLFLDKLEDAPASAVIANHAKLCASPPFGGFGGPFPGQRTDDPHDGVERFPPVSAPEVWWSCLKLMGETLRDAFGLHALPQPNTHVTATRKVAEWCVDVETIAKCISTAAEAGGAGFDASDWTLQVGGAWTIAGMPRPVVGDPDVQLALRRKATPATFVSFAAAPAAARRLGRFDDHLKTPAAVVAAVPAVAPVGPAGPVGPPGPAVPPGRVGPPAPVGGR